jgi:hypothetical protein
MLLIITLPPAGNVEKPGFLRPSTLDYKPEFSSLNHAIFDGKYMDLP